MVPLTLPRKEGSVTVDLESLIEQAGVEMTTPLTLLLIPCGLGGEVGIRSIAVASGP